MHMHGDDVDNNSSTAPVFEKLQFNTSISNLAGCKLDIGLHSRI